MEEILLRTFGVSVEELRQMMEQAFPLKKLEFFTSPEGVDIKIEMRGDKKFLRKVKKILGDYLYSIGRGDMAEVVYSLLKKAKKKLAICESCTGGLISKRLTDISGSSKVFTGGVVAYSNESKEKVLGIPGKLLQEKGAVSYEVASEMAKRVLKIGPADYGLSTTGIAGPSGGTPSKPVGLVYIGLAAKDRDKVKVNKYLFSGNREEIRLSVSQQALALVKQELSKCSTLLK